jgi:hypothetical protein
MDEEYLHKSIKNKFIGLETLGIVELYCYASS